MKKFLKKLLIFALVFFVVDKLFYVLIYLSPHFQTDPRIEMMLNGKINKDIIVLGSSRGAMNIIASQIEKETGQSAYNIAFPGSDVEFHDFILKTLLKYNTKPKTIIFAIDEPSQFLPSTSITFRRDKLYPLVKYSYINQVLIDKGDRNFTSWFMCLSRLNKSNFKLIKKISPTETVQQCGSMPVDFVNPKFKPIYRNEVQPYDVNEELSSKRNAFFSIINQCKKNNINLVITFSPNFSTPSQYFEDRIKSLAPNSNFFIYDTTKSVYKNKSYFYDESHLNKKGAAIFTSEVSAFLNQMSKK